MIIKHRRVQQKDIRDIQLKFSKIFKKKISKKYYIWKYKQQNKFNSFVTTYNGKIIAHVGYSIKKIILENKKSIFFAYRHSSFVLKNYRKKGIYLNLIDYSNSIIKKITPLVICWPNKNNMISSKKIKNFSIIKKINPYEVKFEGKKITNNFIKKNFNLFRKHSFNKNIFLTCHKNWSIKKNDNYLKFRYGLHPDNKYFSETDIENYLIIFKLSQINKKNIINILEFIYKNSPEIYLEKFISKFEFHDCTIQIWLNDHQLNISKKVKFPLIKNKNITFNACYYPITKKIIKNLKNYNYSMGDTDVA